MTLTTLQKKFFAFIMLVSCVNLFMGCNRYFKPVVLHTPTAETKQASLKKLDTENKFFIIRNKDHSYAMKNLVLDEAHMAINASLQEIPKGHHLYINATDDKYSDDTYNDDTYRIPAKGTQEVELFQEVHLFVNDTASLDITHPLVLPFSAVEKIEVIENDKKRTTNSHVWGAVCITLGAAIAIVLLKLIENGIVYN